MSEINYEFSDFSENTKTLKVKPINLKKDIFSTKTLNAKDSSNKSLLIVEKLSRKKNKFGKFKNGLNEEELQLLNINGSHIIDYDKKLAFNLANTIVKRRFKYFGKKNEDDSEDSIEIKSRTIKIIKPTKNILRIEEEEERKRKEKERKERERIERERKEKERLEMLEKEKKEKLKQKEKMKTVEINIEERNRTNHNYKIITKLTTEIEVNEFKNKSASKKPKEGLIKEKYLLKNFSTNNVLDNKSKTSKTIIAKNNRPEINTKRIMITKVGNIKNHKLSNINQVKIEVNKKTVVKEISNIPPLLDRNSNLAQINQEIKHELGPNKNIKSENKKIIIVNKRGDNNKNDEINKLDVRKKIIKNDIAIKKYENYNTEGNIRNRYKNQKVNKNILVE